MQNKQTTSEKNEVRLAVMSEKINNIEGNISGIQDSIKDINLKMDHTYATKEELRAIEMREKETSARLDSTLTWVARLIIGAVIIAMLGFVMSGKVPL